MIGLLQQSSGFVLEPARYLVVLAVLFWVLAVAAGVWFVRSRMRQQARRMELIETALRNPNLGPDVQRELVQALRPRPSRVPFVVGWLGAFAGIGWLCTEPRGGEFTTAVILTVVAFALVTLPLALRELETRRA